MPLAAGVRLGPYEILSAIGAGGMGEVWRAKDTTLGRDVALKILPDHLALDPDRLARFKREAQILASLNHPNIGSIYGFQEADGIQALVLELVDGSTLADRIARGPIPVDEALPIAKQIAEALEAAHEQGIIHRDLKPANVKLRPDGTVKVLDFGLARAVEPVATASFNESQSPTITTPAMTQMGVILGTAAYMSPEQAKGKVVDRRADVWAFGCVLFEMLAGRRAFAGDEVAETLALIITREPDWGALPGQTPTGIRRLLRRALAKNKNERLADIGDARLELKEALAPPEAEIAPTAEGHRRERVAWVLVALVTTVAVALAVSRVRDVVDTVAPPPIRFAVVPPQNVTFGTNNGEAIPAVSPDGRRVAFVAQTAGGPSRLWVRSLDSLEAQPLPGTEGAGFPFWSPESRALGFFAAGRLMTTDAAGGAVRTVCDAQNPRGGTWSSDGVIVFGSQSGGLYSVSASGGSPKPLTALDVALQERAHRYPSFLPDGRHFLYWTTPQNDVVLGSLDSKETTRLLKADSQAVSGAPGSLLFVRRGTLMAQSFDAQRRMLIGEAVPIAERILPDRVGGSAFAASTAGALAYRIGTISGPTQLTWVDRSGKALGTVAASGSYRNPELSPDGVRVAVEVVDPNVGTQDIWVVELARGVASRVTFDPANDVYPVWSPDGTQIMFGSDRNGVYNLYRKRADAAGSETLVLESPTDMVPYSWSPDGRIVVYRTTSAVGGTNLGILSLDGEGAAAEPRPDGQAGRTPHLFEPSPFNQGTSQVSPDGRWVAYVSGESGRNEIHVQSFPSPGGRKIQISRDGSSFARWRRDGRELFYYSRTGRLVAVPVTSGGSTFEVGAAIPLFEPRTLNGPTPSFGFRQQYDVARDGRFLLNVPVEGASSPSITIITNLPAGLEK